MAKLRNYSKEEVARILEDFLNNAGEYGDWDEFCTFPIADPELEHIRERCVQLDKEFPPEHRGAHCGPGGLEVFRTYVVQVRDVSKQCFYSVAEGSGVVAP